MGLNPKIETDRKKVIQKNAIAWALEPGIAFDILAEIDAKEINIFHNRVWLDAYTQSFPLKDNGCIFTIIGRQNGNLIFWLPVEKHTENNVTIINAFAQDTSDSNNNSGAGEFDSKLGKSFSEVPFRKLFPDIDLVLIKNIEVSITPNFSNETNWGMEGYKSYQINLKHYKCDPADNVLGIKLNKSQKKKLKGLQRFGNIRIISATGNEREKLFDAFVDAKRQQLSYLGSANRFIDPKFVNFLRKVFVKNDDTEFKLFGLLIEGKVVATSAVIATNNKWLLYQTTYVEGPESKYSPGKLLLLSIIRISKAADVKIFDMSIGDERYKEILSDSTNQMAYFSQHFSLKGKYYLIKKLGLLKAKNIVKGNKTLFRLAKSVLSALNR